MAHAIQLDQYLRRVLAEDSSYEVVGGLRVEVGEAFGLDFCRQPYRRFAWLERAVFAPATAHAYMFSSVGRKRNRTARHICIYPQVSRGNPRS
jgi:hypothetical protein